ncbi:hypothetical protein [Streptomyces europaeiscabiei]|uniref:hypothetical protein n=1 Tax=Streptomyces europaeiscabiei TaxID=146819 RepID=UPI0029B936EF|nr:hypothetical protein [Streptomyces europaeiscabiei]MDX3672709.1 hypothetical protein [Streptomyces europaeiscabiei]
MSDRHPLVTPDSWVQIRDPRTLKSGDKRRVLRAIRAEEETGEVALSMLDAIAVVAIEAWGLPLPVPAQDAAVLDLMEIADYDKLSDLLGPTQQALFPSPVEATPEQAEDEKSPTEPSAA